MGSGFLMGGLLQGLGQGLTQHAAQMRENALIALRRQYQKEDLLDADKREIAKETRAEERDIRKDDRDFTVKVELLDLAARHKRLEGETDRAWEERLIRIKGEEDRRNATHKGGIDAGLARIDHGYKLTEIQATEKAQMEADLRKAGLTVDHWATTSDGRLVGVSATGQVIARSRNKGSFNPPGSGGDDDDSGGSIAAAQARRNGTEPPAKGAAKPGAAKPRDNNAAARAQALATLGNVWHHATEAEYPGLYRDGKKISMEEAKALIKQRYP